MAMKLYPYQKKILDEALLHLEAQNRVMIVIPTGGGKTVIFSHLIKTMKLKSLIIAHTKEIVTQCNKTLEKVGVASFARAVTIQYLIRTPDIANQYDLLVVDECHRAASVSYLKVIEKFSGKKLIGTTATPFRSDGQWLENIFGLKISPLSILDMIEEGLLSDLQGFRVKTDVSLRGISTKNGDFISSKLSAVINVKNRNELIVSNYKKIADGEKALCFTSNILHAEELAKCFREKGINCFAVHGELTKLRRESLLEKFKQGEIKVLTSCSILTEGFDEPSITCLLMARPTLSKVLYIQMIGRGSRLFPGKSVCKVIEFTDCNYDVTDMNDILFGKTKMRNPQYGEKIRDYIKKEKVFLNEVKNTKIEEYKVIAPVSPIQNKLITAWQKSFLTKAKISFNDEMTEMEANILISKVASGE